jgi:adenine-specific DNA-methyltransferase
VFAHSEFKSNNLTIVDKSLTFVEQIDLIRRQAILSLNNDRQNSLGQFFTPFSVAKMMSSMFETDRRTIRLLDAGAGAGVLTASFVAKACAQKNKPQEIAVTVFELDQNLIPYLEQTLARCRKECEKNGINFTSEIRNVDFITVAVNSCSNGLFDTEEKMSFDLAILNPPYGKINTNSEANRLLRSCGINAPNLYAAFLALSAEMLVPDGELVAITPRSFCNGNYFKPFRQYFTERMTFRRFHVFDSRKEIFDDDILQENIIFHAVKNKSEEFKNSEVIISTSHNGFESDENSIRIKGNELIKPNDKELFIHLGGDELDQEITERMRYFQTPLEDLGLIVSTGKIVDFRIKEFLQNGLDAASAPLIYPHNIQKGFVNYPVAHSKKHDAVQIKKETESFLIEKGVYVVVKRFSSKEEKRRVTAALITPDRVPNEKIALENHLNYFHAKGHGLNADLAKGLALYLNSSILDASFRQFSGHTQVNASDLRYLKYPTREELVELGKHFNGHLPSQEEIDLLINRILLKMSDTNFDIEAGKGKLDEALSVLQQLGFPAAQQNERSALSLLALLNLKPNNGWSAAESPMVGVTQMMKYFASVYGKEYMPNTRESVRKLTIHQFLDAGLIVINPDKPDRAINSGSTVYQIAPVALTLLRKFGTEEWDAELEKYLSEVGTLREKYAQARDMKRLPVTLPGGQAITLSPGGQNVLITEIIENFCAYFTPDGKVLYIGDADEKWAVFDEQKLGELGVTVDSHGKMPDVVVFYEAKNWLVLIEAVTSHGPVNPKRREELKKLFFGATVGLVYVTAFPDRKTMVRYLSEIAWETEVWVADAPTHLIHFNGERFLGPYES